MINVSAQENTLTACFKRFNTGTGSSEARPFTAGNAVYWAVCPGRYSEERLSEGTEDETKKFVTDSSLGLTASGLRSGFAFPPSA
jgi:hypothetical protein